MNSSLGTFKCERANYDPANKSRHTFKFLPNASPKEITFSSRSSRRRGENLRSILLLIIDVECQWTSFHWIRTIATDRILCLHRIDGRSAIGIHPRLSFLLTDLSSRPLETFPSSRQRGDWHRSEVRGKRIFLPGSLSKGIARCSTAYSSESNQRPLSHSGRTLRSTNSRCFLSGQSLGRSAGSGCVSSFTLTDGQVNLNYLEQPNQSYHYSSR